MFTEICIQALQSPDQGHLAPTNVFYHFWVLLSNLSTKIMLYKHSADVCDSEGATVSKGQML